MLWKALEATKTTKNLLIEKTMILKTAVNK
jgi:hypothetical protein